MRNPLASLRRPAGPPQLALVACLLCIGAAASAAPAVAQFDQYKPPGGLVEPPADRKGSLDQAAENARWHLGPVKLAPWWELRDLQYVDNAFGSSEGKQGDITASMGAGLRAYFRTGPKVYWAVRVLPEYVWWQKTAERRRLGGRYGVGAFAFFNRLTVEATAERSQEQTFLSPEIAALAQSRSDRGGVSLDLSLTDRISLFGGVEEVRIRNLVSREVGEAPFDQFDRDESFLRGGARYRLPRGFSIGVGVERSTIDFIDVPGRLDRSSSGTSPFLQIRQQNDDHFFDLEVASRSAEPRPGSSFVPYDSATANLSAGFKTGGRLSAAFYGGRGIVYTLAEGYSYLVDDRVGASLSFDVSPRTKARIFAEVGRDDFRRAALAPADTPERRDDLRAYGASIDLSTGRSSSFGLRFSRTEIDSNLSGFDRSIAAIGAGITFRGGDAGW